eukprot:NODE_4985_length_994_cov_116.176808_g4778_i0.p1 GENE.NODE_4985_length_994_cov_116.176808_g4778_i0~~NODE_4985_length_994_cov_116.176808_g4778_i0.p1  ORF type:complete len:227 (-),score=65.94 NODE_4985_length_994_cov_116.176808_g4778_i0:217-897(-)
MKLGQPPAKLQMNKDGLISSFLPAATKGQEWKPDINRRLKAEEQEEAVKRLYDLEKTKREATEKKLAVKYFEEPTSKKLTKEQMDEQIERVFKQASLNHHTRLAQAVARNTPKEESKRLTAEEQEEFLQRLYELQRTKDREKINKLRKKYYTADGPKSARLTADEQKAQKDRMYKDGMEHRNVVLAKLSDKYVKQVAPWEKHAKLTPREQEENVGRLSTPRAHTAR